MLKSNKANGNELERIFAEALSVKGCWVHRVQDNANGQPFDIISIKNNISHVYDCKDCKNDIFVFNRIEDNQRLAFNKFLYCGNIGCYIAVRFKSASDKVYLLRYEFIKEWEAQGKKHITYKEVKNGHICDYVECGQYTKSSR